MIAANMASALKSADKEAVGIFISVDTERDTPTITDDYAQRFGATMLGLSGSYEQVSVNVVLGLGNVPLQIESRIKRQENITGTKIYDDTDAYGLDYGFFRPRVMRLLGRE